VGATARNPPRIGRPGGDTPAAHPRLASHPGRRMGRAQAGGMLCGNLNTWCGSYLVFTWVSLVKLAP
jgi:hypothetical protein